MGQWCVLLQPVLGRGRESPPHNPDSQSQEPCQRVVAVVRAGHQPIWMFVAAKGAEAHQHSEWTIKKIAGVRSLARQVQSRVATVTLDMAEQYPNKSFWVSHVAVPRKHLGLEECIELPAHVLVAGRSAGSVKCTSACRSASTSTRVSGCPRRAHSGKRKIHPFIPLPPGSPDPGPPPPTSEMG